MNIFNFFTFKKPNVGDKYVDKKWGDTILQVINIDNSGRNIRYKFLQIDGQKIPESFLYDMKLWFLKNKYRKLNHDQKNN